MGSHGFYTALHSVNFSQYAPGKYDAYVVLGNQFKFGDATIQLDLMNRGASARELLFDNFSIMGEVDYLIAKRVNIFAKVTYDKVGQDYPAGLFLFPGTEMTRVGGGVEYYPIGNRNVRLHAAYAHTFGVNTNFEPEKDCCGNVVMDANGTPKQVFKGTARNGLGYLTVGLTWKIDLLSAAERLINSVKK